MEINIKTNGMLRANTKVAVLGVFLVSFFSSLDRDSRAQTGRPLLRFMSHILLETGERRWKEREMP